MEVHDRIHFGSGVVYLNGWINVDLDSPVADRCLDLTEPLPFISNTVSHIYSEHFIEHVTRAQAISFLRECHRVLMPGGAIRISTPNLRFLISSYLAGNIDEWGDLWQPDTLCSMMNEGMRAWGHHWVYDAEELVRVLQEAGFNSIVFQHYGKSQQSEFTGLESRPFHHDLIVEATRSVRKPLVDFSALREDEQNWINQRALLEAKEQTIGDQATHIGNVEAELNKLKSSLSWRLTLPIRQFAEFLKLNK